ncbi:hypothetical protein ACFL3T_01295 [Patescibacteria group bacterium]
MPRNKGPKKPDRRDLNSAEASREALQADGIEQLDHPIEENADSTARQANIVTQAGEAPGRQVRDLTLTLRNAPERLAELIASGVPEGEATRIITEEIFQEFSPLIIDIPAAHETNGEFAPEQTPGPEAYERYGLLKQQKMRILDAQRGCALRALQTGKQETHALYYDKEKWRAVSEDEEYRKRQLELTIILENLQLILEICGHPGAKDVNVCELGPGDGTKSNKIRKALHELGISFTHHHYDASPAMLLDTLIKPVVDIATNAVNTARKGRAREDHPFKELVEFIIRTKVRIPQYQNNALQKIEIMLHRMIAPDVRDDDPEYDKIMKVRNGDFFKFCLARMFSLHSASNAKEIKSLDEEVKLPYKFVPHHKRFDQIDPEEIAADEDTATIIFHQGNEICNSHPSEPIEKLYHDILLNDPVVPEEIEDPDERERLTQATYAVVGFQIGKFDEPGRHNGELQKEARRILKGYDIPPFNEFVSHLFTDEDGTFVKFVDGGGRRIKPENCIEVKAEFTEDPDNPGFYGTVHTLRFTRKVNAVVDRIGSGLQVVEKNKGDEILLLPSYKPTIDQMIQLFEEKHIKVIKILTQDMDDPTHAVFVVRKMSQEEIDQYEAKEHDGEIPSKDSQKIMTSKHKPAKKKIAAKRIKRTRRKKLDKRQLKLIGSNSS